MLICPESGTTLAVTKETITALKRNQISNNFAFLLVQRGMADYPGSRPISTSYENIFPTFFLIDLTKHCNLNCIYCFRDLGTPICRMTKEKLTEICDALISYSYTHGKCMLTLQAWGGEPLLELESIVWMRKMFADAGLHPQIVIETNATLISEDVANTLRQNDIQVGVSVDGHALIQDMQRPFVGGAPSSSAIERGIHNLKKAGYSKVGSITVVTKETFWHLPEILSYFVDTLHLNSIKLNLMRRNDTNRELAISPDDIPEYLELLLDTLHSFYEKRIPIIEQNISQRLRNLYCRPCNNICNAHGCHGGYRMLSINSEGKVFPCELSDFSDYAIGAIPDNDFPGMVERAIHARHEYFAPRDLTSCADCPWIFYCRGGCRSAAKYDKGSPLGIETTECRFNQELYPRLIKILMNEPKFSLYLMNGVV